MAYAPMPALIATPIGMIAVEGDDAQLTAIRIIPEHGGEQPGSGRAVAEAGRQIRAYFSDRAFAFDLPLAPAATARGQALRDAIAAVAPGETPTYGDLAAATASSPRAVGQACAHNPFPLVIPCHRILASGGKLGAYSAGAGPTTKIWLLTHEGMKGALL
jgi:methylated-DNA-[protein]-cysteine S-methyltransferase